MKLIRVTGDNNKGFGPRGRSEITMIFSDVNVPSELISICSSMSRYKPLHSDISFRITDDKSLVMSYSPIEYSAEALKTAKIMTPEELLEYANKYEAVLQSHIFDAKRILDFMNHLRATKYVKRANISSMYNDTTMSIGIQYELEDNEEINSHRYLTINIKEIDSYDYNKLISEIEEDLAETLEQYLVNRIADTFERYKIKVWIPNVPSDEPHIIKAYDGVEILNMPTVKELYDTVMSWTEDDMNRLKNKLIPIELPKTTTAVDEKKKAENKKLRDNKKKMEDDFKQTIERLERMKR